MRGRVAVMGVWAPLLWLLVSGLTLGCGPRSDRQPPRAEQGEIDLRTWDFERDGAVTLDGDWVWYWSQLVPPGPAAGAPTDGLPRATGLFRFPNVWNGQIVDGQRLSSGGYATFRLRVRVPGGPRREPLGMLLRLTSVAYVLWADEVELARSGTLGTSAATTVPSAITRAVYFTPRSDEVVLTLQLANFHHSRGGPRAGIVLGPAERIRESRERRVALSAFIVGSLTLIVLYQLTLFALRPKELTPLYLAVISVLVAVWYTMHGPLLFSIVFPTARVDLMLRLEYASLYLTPAAVTMFLRALYPEHRLAWPGRVGAVVCVALTALALVASPMLTTRTLVPFATMVTVMSGFGLWFLFQAARQHRTEGALLLTGLAALSLAAGSDSVQTLQPQYVNAMTPLGFVFLILMQALVLSRRSAHAYLLVEEQAQTLAQLNAAYYRFVPQEFLRLLGKDDIRTVQLGDQAQRQMTILFADVRGFTSLSERMTLSDNFAFVNTLLGNVGPLIREHGGFIDKYLGDGIMALFPTHADDALRAAVQMRRALAKLNSLRATQNLPEVRIGMGIHAGLLMLGTVGEPARMDGTVIADAVNTTARLEGLTKLYGVTVLLSEEARAKLRAPDAYTLRMLGKVRAKGKRDPLVIYELIDGDSDEQAQRKRETRAQFEAGLRHYQAGEFAAAVPAFQAVLAHNPDDAAARHYCAQAARFAQLGAPAGWDGVDLATEK